MNKLPTFRKGERVVIYYPWREGAPKIEAKINRIGERHYHVDGHGAFERCCNRHIGCYSFLEKLDKADKKGGL